MDKMKIGRRGAGGARYRKDGWFHSSKNFPTDLSDYDTNFTALTSVKFAYKIRAIRGKHYFSTSTLINDEG